MTSGRHGEDDYVCVCIVARIICNVMPLVFMCVHACQRPTLVTAQYAQPHTHAHPHAHPHIRTHIHPSTSTQAHTHTHLDLLQHVSCVVHNDEEWFQLFDGRTLVVAVLLVLLLELEEETVVVSTWEAGIRREGGREEERECG